MRPPPPPRPTYAHTKFFALPENISLPLTYHLFPLMIIKPNPVL